MPREENTADGFPDKSEFIPPAKIRRKPDCDRKTLIPDPCDLRIDRRKKSEESNDCNTEPVVQVCPEDLGKFQIPEVPVVPTVFTPKNFEPIVVPRLPDPPPPDRVCNDLITVNCPSDGWLDADWVKENTNTNVDIQIDEFGGVTDIQDTIDTLGLSGMLPDDPSIYVAPDDSDKSNGPTITVEPCSFIATTKLEANKLAKIYAVSAIVCEFCNPDVTVDCSDLQALALPVGGVGYTLDNTAISISGDGNGAQLTPVIDENGTITDITVVDPGEGYRSIVATISGDGVGAAIGRIVLEEAPCGGGVLEVYIGQTLPDPKYDLSIDPPIISSVGTVCVPACSFTSPESKEAAEELAREAALAALDCAYQSKELDKPCPDPQVPKSGFNLPLGAFKTQISRGTQESVDKQAKSIIDALECIDVVCPDGFPEAIVDIQIYDPNEDCDEDGGSTNNSWFDANFDEANCAYKLEGVLELPEIPCPCGFETSVAVTQAGGGEDCDAPEWAAANTYDFGCDTQQWNTTKTYRIGTSVTYNQKVFRSLTVNKNSRPGEDPIDWQYIEPCADNPTQVKHDYKLYENTRWTKGDVPGGGGPWKYLGKCGEPPEEEEEEKDCNGSIDLGVLVSGGSAEFDFDPETCTFDLDIELPSVQLTCEEITFGW